MAAPGNDNMIGGLGDDTYVVDGATGRGHRDSHGGRVAT